MQNHGGFEYKINIHSETRKNSRTYVAIEIMGAIVRELCSNTSIDQLKVDIKLVRMRKPDFISYGPLSKELQHFLEAGRQQGANCYA